MSFLKNRTVSRQTISNRTFFRRTVSRLAVFLAVSVLLLSLAGCEVSFPETLQTKTIKGDAIPTRIPLSLDGTAGLSVEIELTLAETEKTPIVIHPLPDGETPFASVCIPDGFEAYGFFARQEENGVFRVGAEQNYRFKAPDLRLDIYAPVSECALAGELEAEMDCGGDACPAEVTLTLSGAVDVSAERINAESVTVTAAGAADIDLSGVCRALSLSIAGAGEIDAEDLSSADCVVSVTGAGSAEVAASDTLDVTVAGAGSVVYSGEPVVTKNITGAGFVTQK